MWDKPHLLRQISGALFGFSFALLMYGVLYFILHLPLFPLRVLQLSAAPQQVDIAQIEAVARNELRGNFFTVDIEHVRAAFEKLPWVRTVSIRRHFPWQLEVSLEEHVALAHWNGSKLVNTYGEVFEAETKQTLPGFIGQPDSAAEVTQMYAAFGKRLMPLGQGIAQISLSQRRAWQLRLDSGMVLELGRELSEQRLANFVAVYPYSLATMGRKINYVDLRYRNGFAAYLPGGVSAPDGQGKHGENAGNRHSKV